MLGLRKKYKKKYFMAEKKLTLDRLVEIIHKNFAAMSVCVRDVRLDLDELNHQLDDMEKWLDDLENAIADFKKKK